MADDPAALTEPSSSGAASRSLVEDVVHLIEDGKVYLDAEIQYQKSRAGVVGSGARKAAVLAALAFAFVLLALLAITVGLLLALAPLLGVWGAMAAVTMLLLGAAGICAVIARDKWRLSLRHLEDVRNPPVAADD